MRTIHVCNVLLRCSGPVHGSGSYRSPAADIIIWTWVKALLRYLAGSLVAWAANVCHIRITAWSAWIRWCHRRLLSIDLLTVLVHVLDHSSDQLVGRLRPILKVSWPRHVWPLLLLSELLWLWTITLWQI